jgi:hypothetical protein
MCSPVNTDTVESPLECLCRDTEEQQDVPIIQRPQCHKAKISVWADLSVTDMDCLDQVTTTEGMRSELAQIFHLEDYCENKRNSILLDLYFYAVKFARDNFFSREQTSAFFSIIKRTHEVCIETPYGNFEQCFYYFKEMVLCHAIRRPPFSIDLFTADDVRMIMEYGINTYFRNFKLYKFIYTPQVLLDLTMVYKGMPPSPRPPTVLEEDIAQPSVCETTAPEAVVTEPLKMEDSEGASELKRLIRQHLTDEMKQLRLSVDQQIKQTEEDIGKRIEASGGSPAKPTKETKKK